MIRLIVFIVCGAIALAYVGLAAGAYVAMAF